MSQPRTPFIKVLDGTLIDGVYQSAHGVDGVYQSAYGEEFPGDPFSGFHDSWGDELHEQLQSFFEDVSSLVKLDPIVYFGLRLVLLIVIVRTVYGIIVSLKKAWTEFHPWIRLATADTNEASNPHQSSQDIENAATPPHFAVHGIIVSLKKAWTEFHPCIRLATADTDEASNPHQSSQDIENAATPPHFAVPQDSQVEHATVERFLSIMAREKPIRFSPKQLAAFTENYSTKLGSGGFGVVYKGKFPNGVQIAVKALNGELNKRVEEQFMAEVSTMGRTYHINLVRLYGFCFDPMMRALVYEYMENGSLDHFLFRENSQEMLEWEKLYDIAIGTAKGIAYLHEECQQRIIHYDIKPGNVLLDTNLNPKVADFGLAKLCNRGSSRLLLTNGRGTPGYAAPELWKPYPVTYKCDVYSFGMLLFEIVGRKRNFDENQNESRQWLPRWTWDMFDNKELAVMMSLCGIEEKHKEKVERMIMVALWCVQYSPDSRPLMSTVVKMLEGSMEITPPPFPFEHMVSPNPTMNLDNGSNGGSYTSSISSSSANTLEHSNSNPMHRTFEIELAT